MKEILIRVRIEGDEIESVVKHKGFYETAETSLTIIGVLENLKMLEQDKLKAIAKIKAIRTKDVAKDGLGK